MSKLCKDCACEWVCGITHTPELNACENYKAEAFTEIEKLKAEIDKLEMFYLYSNDDLISKKEVFEIIDTRISELKGE